MNGPKRLRLGLIAAATAALVVIGALAAYSQVSAATGTVSIESVTVAPGEQRAVTLSALDMTAPGLGAWEIGIVYNPAVVTPVACSPAAGSFCNVNFAPNRVQVTGASASGHQGDTALATITFRCGEILAASALSLSVDELADATTGGPQGIGVTMQNGLVTCAEVSPPHLGRPTATPTEEEPAPTAEPTVAGLPATGTGDDSGGGSVLGRFIAVLAGAGIAAIGSFVALRRRARST